MKFDKSIINYEIYENGVNLLGTASVTLPEVNNLTQTLTGAGIAGEIESVLQGMISAMSSTINFHTVSKDAAKLADQRSHLLDLRVANENLDSGSGVIGTTAIKYIMRVTSKSFKPGTVAPATTGGVSGDYAVSYFAMYNNGVKTVEVDPLNYICVVNGVDALASVRAALGR